MKTETEPKQTAMQRLISELEDIKQTKCKTLQEVIFFDGVLAIIESKYLPEERKEIEEAYNLGSARTEYDNIAGIKLTISSTEYFTTNFKQ